MLGMTSMEVALQRKYQAEANADKVIIEKLLKQRTELLTALALEQAGSRALQAALGAMREAHPDSPLLAPTGRTLNTGKPEIVLQRDHFAPAFDKAAAERKIKDPEKRRDHPVK